MEEIWKDVVGYEQYFRVSNLGRVWSKRTNKILKTVAHPNGYCVFCTRFGGRNSPAVMLRVHRLVAEAFIGNPQNKPFVNHKDGVKTNNVAENLEWVTKQENVRHAWDNGLAKAMFGERNPNCKISDNQAIEVKNLYATGNFSHRKLGEIYSVSHHTIQDAIKRALTLETLQV